MQLKLALVGYGRMGQAIEQEALARGHEIVRIIDLDNRDEIQDLRPADAIIEFTHPDSFDGNLEALLPQGIPVVTGTTGWYDRIGAVKEQVAKHGATLMYTANFSIGVNILFQLNARLATLMNAYPQYDCLVEERHHKFKADGPSGTALRLGRDILDQLDRKSRIAPAGALSHRPPEDDELSIGYVRAGGIPGTHTVGYTSEIDAITLTHTAFSRKGFALGAVIAAEWIQGRQGFFEFQALFQEEGSEKK